MRTVSNEFKNELNNGNRKFLGYADITLEDNTVLNLTNAEIMVGGFSCEDAVSNDSSFEALGAVIINSAKLIINNMGDNYSEYDFTNAKVVLRVGLQLSNTTEDITLGTYRVDEPTYTGGRITLSLLDYMEQFDRPYVTSLAYPATLYEIVSDACSRCGVILGTTTFPHYNYNVSNKPSGDDTTFREVISWVATIAGCFARCDKDGKLELKWFDLNTLDSLVNEEDLDGGVFDSTTEQSYQSGVNADGGTFNPWNTGYEFDSGNISALANSHTISSLKLQNVAVDNTVITGVSITVKGENSSSNTSTNDVIITTGDNVITYMTGSEGYVINITDNELITNSNAMAIIAWLGSQLIGTTFRKLSVDCLADPTIEAGDVARVFDRKGNTYAILVTRVTFAIGKYQTIVSASDTPLKNSATRFSAATKAYLKSRKELLQEKSARELAVQALTQGLAAKSGLYTTIEPTQSGDIFYMHDKPNLNDSHVVWKMTAEAWGVTTQYNSAHPEQTVWNAGMTVDGNVIANILSANGVNADWINTGRLRSQDGSVYIDLDNNVISINGQTTFLSANDVGANGTTTIDGGRITTGIIEGGGTANDPNFKLVMSTGELTMKNGSINIGNGKFQVDTSGNLTAQNASLIGNLLTKSGTTNRWMRVEDGVLYGGTGTTYTYSSRVGEVDCSDLFTVVESGSSVNRYGVLACGSTIRLASTTLYVGATTNTLTGTFYKAKSTTITINGTSYKFVNGILVYDNT